MRRNQPSKKYVVGYVGEENGVYGPDYDDKVMFIDRMSIVRARLRLKELLNCGSKACVYELVPVETYRLEGEGKTTLIRPRPKKPNNRPKSLRRKRT